MLIFLDEESFLEHLETASVLAAFRPVEGQWRSTYIVPESVRDWKRLVANPDMEKIDIEPVELEPDY
jgi:hypothetical protein